MVFKFGFDSNDQERSTTADTKQLRQTARQNQGAAVSAAAAAAAPVPGEPLSAAVALPHGKGPRATHADRQDQRTKERAYWKSKSHGGTRANKHGAATAAALMDEVDKQKARADHERDKHQEFRDMLDDGIELPDETITMLKAEAEQIRKAAKAAKKAAAEAAAAQRLRETVTASMVDEVFHEPQGFVDRLVINPAITWACSLVKASGPTLQLKWTRPEDNAILLRAAERLQDVTFGAQSVVPPRPMLPAEEFKPTQLAGTEPDRVRVLRECTVLLPYSVVPRRFVVDVSILAECKAHASSFRDRAEFVSVLKRKLGQLPHSYCIGLDYPNVLPDTGELALLLFDARRHVLRKTWDHEIPFPARQVLITSCLVIAGLTFYFPARRFVARTKASLSSPREMFMTPPLRVLLVVVTYLGSYMARLALKVTGTLGAWLRELSIAMAALRQWLTLRR